MLFPTETRTPPAWVRTFDMPSCAVQSCGVATLRASLQLWLMSTRDLIDCPTLLESSSAFCTFSTNHAPARLGTSGPGVCLSDLDSRQLIRLRRVIADEAVASRIAQKLRQ